MKESHRKGVASHPVPESCVASRKAGCEALTGAHAGGISSCEISGFGVPTSSTETEGHTDGSANASFQRTPRWHEPVAEVGKWLRSVVQGYFNYHAVPSNIDSLQSFRAQVVWHWSRALQRRSQKSRMPWERFAPLVARWIPSATILHPRPAMRFNARHLR
jgi:hypothetical protein